MKKVGAISKKKNWVIISNFQHFDDVLGQGFFSNLSKKTILVGLIPPCLNREPTKRKRSLREIATFCDAFVRV